MSNLITKTSGIIPGLEDVDLKEVLRPINCHLLQPQSPGVNPLEVGKFKFDTGELRDKLENVVVLLIKQSRVLYGKEMGGDPLCASDNAKVPSTRIESPMNTSCASCPMSRWSNDSQKPMTKTEIELKNKITTSVGKPIADKPLCRHQYMLLVVDQGSMVPYWVAFAMGQMKTVNQQLIGSCAHRGISPFMATVTINVAEKSKGINKWFEMYFSNMTPIQDYTQYQIMWQRYSNVAQDLLSEEFESRSEKSEEPDEIPF